MSVFETILSCILIIFLVIFTYIAGKYDLLYVICKMLEEKCEECKERDND